MRNAGGPRRWGCSRPTRGRSGSGAGEAGAVPTAAEFALQEVSRVRDDPDARLTLMARLYAAPDGAAMTHLPYRRAAVAFVGWKLRRGLLRPLHGPQPGSPRWRAVNERLLRDGWEARALDAGYDPVGATASASPSLRFVRDPTARNWYRARTTSASSRPASSTEASPRKRAGPSASTAR